MCTFVCKIHGKNVCSVSVKMPSGIPSILQTEDIGHGTSTTNWAWDVKARSGQRRHLWCTCNSLICQTTLSSSDNNKNIFVHKIQNNWHRVILNISVYLTRLNASIFIYIYSFNTANHKLIIAECSNDVHQSIYWWQYWLWPLGLQRRKSISENIPESQIIMMSI